MDICKLGKVIFADNEVKKGCYIFKHRSTAELIEDNLSRPGFIGRIIYRTFLSEANNPG